MSASHRALRVLEFIRSYLSASGRPPTVREIGEHLGIRSPNGVACHLESLERHGHIQRIPRTSRGIKVIEPKERSVLVLTRKELETIKIGDEIEIRILDLSPTSVKIGIDAPRVLRVTRGEKEQDHGESRPTA